MLALVVLLHICLVLQKAITMLGFCTIVQCRDGGPGIDLQVRGWWPGNAQAQSGFPSLFTFQSIGESTSIPDMPVSMPCTGGFTCSSVMLAGSDASHGPLGILPDDPQVASAATERSGCGLGREKSSSIHHQHAWRCGRGSAHQPTCPCY